MAKLQRQVGTTSQLVDVLFQDSSSTTGAGLGSVAYNTSGISAYYHRNTAAASVAISLATMTLGTWATGGLVLVDNTNMKGLCQLGVPNAALASGADSVVIYIYGVTNMAPLVLEIELTATSNQDAVHGGMSALPNTACTTNASLLTSGTGTDQLTVTSGRIDVGKILGTASAGAAGYVGIDWAHINAPTTTVGLTGTTISTSQAIASVSGSVGSVTGAVGSVTGSVGSVTGSVGSISGVTFPTHFSVLAIDASGDVTFNNTTLATVTTVTNQLTAAAVASGVWKDAVAGDFTVASSAGKKLQSLAVGTSDVLHTATAPSQAGMTSTQITLDSGASASNNAYQWDVISITAGTDAGDSRIITAYTGSTTLATVQRAWTVQPDATSVFEITPTASVSVVSYITGQDPASLVLDVAQSSHNIPGTIGADIGTSSGGSFPANFSALSITAGGLVATAGPFKIDTASGFEFTMVQSIDHATAYTAGGVTGVRSIVGGSESAVSGTITQIGTTGRYYFAGAAADFNGASVGFAFSASGADTVVVSVNTTP